MTPIVLSLFGVVFLALVIHGRLRYRHTTLATLEPLPDETLLFEDDAAHFSAYAFNAPPRGPFVFQRAVVRVTDRRIVVAQPALFSSSQRVIRYAIFTGPIPAALGSVLVDGYLSFVAGDARVTEVQGRRVLEVAPAQAGAPYPRYVLIESPRLDEYEAAVTRRAV